MANYNSRHSGLTIDDFDTRIGTLETKWTKLEEGTYFEVHLDDGTVNNIGTFTHDGNFINNNGNFYISNTDTANLTLTTTTSGNWAYIRFHNNSNFFDVGTNVNTTSDAGNFEIRPNGSDLTKTYFRAGGGVVIANPGVSSIDGLWNESALQLRESCYYGYNANNDTWGQAPRLTFHWAGRVAAQIGLASNGYLYTAPVTGTSFHQISYSGGSSRYIKHNIKDLPEMGDEIDNLNPVSFIYNDNPDEGIRYGLIFEDTIDILPDICKYDDNQYGGKKINYDDLIPILIKEIQSLRQRIKKLENKK